MNLKVCASNIKLELANIYSNLNEIKRVIDDACLNKADVVCFNKLTLTGNTLKDLYKNHSIIKKSEEALLNLQEYSVDKNIIIIVGSIYSFNNNLYDTAHIFYRGGLLGIVSNYTNDEIFDNPYNEDVFTNDLIFKTEDFSFGVVLDGINNSYQSEKLFVSGADIVFDLSANPRLIKSLDYIHDSLKLTTNSGGAYVYVSSNASESSSEYIYSGDIIFYEDSKLLKEDTNLSFDTKILYEEFDLDLIHNRSLNKKYDDDFIYFEFIKNERTNTRVYDKYPFILKDEEKRDKRSEEILNLLSYSLARRLKHVNVNKVVIGLSGGLDSTIALLTCLRAFKVLNYDNKGIIAVTMPGFGTSNTTYDNVYKLASAYNIDLKEINIKKACEQHFIDISHDINIHNETYENAQARERTQILMDIANKENGIVVGTGDLSELALGWCTYNGDHMSMYSLNHDLPKTLIRYIVNYVAKVDNVPVLNEIVNTPVSPELLPTDSLGNIKQKTEDKIGPYVLHDFFLYHFIRNNFSFSKIYSIACDSFKDEFSNEEIKKWLTVFIKRFISQQYKRNCGPDGIRIGTVSLRNTNFKMNSDISYKLFLDEIESL